MERTERFLSGKSTGRKSDELKGVCMAAKRGRPRKNTKVGSGGFHPSEEELNNDMGIDAAPEEVASALFSKDLPSKVAVNGNCQ